MYDQQLADANKEIAKLKEKLKVADGHAEHCRKDALKAIGEMSRVTNRATQDVATLRAALRETREVLRGIYATNRDDLTTEERVSIRAVLAKHAALEAGNA